MADTTAMKQVERKLRVCASRKCSECSLDIRVVPDDCEYIMKHLLETEPENIVIKRGRRTGKTTDIVNHALDASKAGYKVIILVPNYAKAHRLQRRLMGTGIEILASSGSRTEIQRVLRNRKSSVVFSDELGQWIADAINKTFQYHYFVLGCQ